MIFSIGVRYYITYNNNNNDNNNNNNNFIQDFIALDENNICIINF